MKQSTRYARSRLRRMHARRVGTWEYDGRRGMAFCRAVVNGR